MTPDKIETRIGQLDFYDGVPTEATVQKVYDNLDYLRGIDVFLNFIPACNSLGVSKYNEVLLMDKLMDSKSLFLTGNTDTVYASSFFDLSKTGPLVVEIPKGAGPGTVNDAFFRFVVDMGAPGPDRKKGGTYIIRNRSPTRAYAAKSRELDFSSAGSSDGIGSSFRCAMTAAVM